MKPAHWLALSLTTFFAGVSVVAWNVMLPSRTSATSMPAARTPSPTMNAMPPTCTSSTSSPAAHTSSPPTVADEGSSNRSLSSEEIVESSYREGIAAYERKEYRLAIECFDKAIWFNPRHIDSYNRRLWAFVFTSQLGKALNDASNLMQIDSANKGSWLGLRAFVNYLQCNYDEAIKDCTDAIQTGLKDASVYVTRAGSYLGKNDHRKAIADASHAIQLNPNFSLAYSIRGKAYNAMGDKPQEAIVDFTHAIKANPNDQYAYACRGFALCTLGHYLAAIQDGLKALQIDPDCIDAHSMLGTAYGRLGDESRANFHNQRFAALYRQGGK